MSYQESWEETSQLSWSYHEHDQYDYWDRQCTWCVYGLTTCRWKTCDLSCCVDKSDGILKNAFVPSKICNHLHISVCVGDLGFDCVSDTIQCIPVQWVCDGLNDCYTIRDELNCDGE